MRHTDFIEKKRHGSPGFPIEYYLIDASSPQYVMQPHWHKEFEIIRVLEGTFTVHLNSQQYNLKSGDVLLVEGGCLHTGEPQSSVYECLVFDPAMLKRQQNDATEKYLLPIIKTQIQLKNAIDRNDTEITIAIDLLFTSIRQQETYFELTVYGALFRVLALLYTKQYITSAKKLPHSTRAQTMTTLIDWIERNFAEQITLEQLSAIAELSPKYLCRVFKEYTSKTLIQYINELRIENACFEMAYKGKSITQAAYDSGFNELSYFCKIFKQHKGITPKEYRLQAQKL